MQPPQAMLEITFLIITATRGHLQVLSQDVCVSPNSSLWGSEDSSWCPSRPPLGQELPWMLLRKLCAIAEEVPCVQTRGPVTTWGTLDNLPANQHGEKR